MIAWWCYYQTVPDMETPLGQPFNTFTDALTSIVNSFGVAPIEQRDLTEQTLNTIFDRLGITATLTSFQWGTLTITTPTQQHAALLVLHSDELLYELQQHSTNQVKHLKVRVR